MRTFLKKVPHNVRVALIAFAGDPQVAAPPTTDLDVVRQGLDSLGYYSGYGGTAIGDALAAAVDLVKPKNPNGTQTIAYTTIANAKKSPVSILFLSDGHQTRGLLQPLEGADRAKAAGIPVYTIALGTPNGVLDPAAGRIRRRRGRRLRPRSGLRPGPDPRPARPGHPASDRADDRREVLRRALGAGAGSAYSQLGSVVARMNGKREATNEFLGLAAILLVAAGAFSALVAPRLP